MPDARHTASILRTEAAAPRRGFWVDRTQATVAPGWPDDPATVAEGRAHPEVFAGKSVGGITDHVAEVIAGLRTKPVVVEHSFGGLITQKIAGQLKPGPVPVRLHQRRPPGRG